MGSQTEVGEEGEATVTGEQDAEGMDSSTAEELSPRSPGELRRVGVKKCLS